MPKKKLPVRKTLEKKLETFGMSYNAVQRIGALTPKMPLRDAIRGMARFMLKAESPDERRWLEMGKPVIERTFGKVALMRQKAFKFQLPGVVYTPDFFYILEDGQRIHVEVKGSKYQSNYRDARKAITIAATLYWFDMFVEVRWEHKEWVVDVIPIDTDYATELQSFMDLVEKEQNEMSTTPA